MTRHCFYSIATGPYISMFEMLKNILRKFDKTSDFILFGENDIKQSNDPMILYRAAPYFAKKLFEQGYTEVCKLDADSIILGNLDHIWEGDYDVAVVNNFNSYQYKEQDLLNLIVFYFNNELGGPYKIKFLDNSDKWHGLIAKGYWPNAVLKNEKIILPENNSDNWPNDESKQLVVWTNAGGHNSPDKMKYRLFFNDEVTKFIDKLVKG